MIGKIVSHYRVLEKLGGGGTGVVYKGEDLKLHRCAALKFLPERLAKAPQALQRFFLRNTKARRGCYRAAGPLATLLASQNIG